MKQETRTVERMLIKEQVDSLRDGKVVGYTCTACDKDSITPIVRCPGCGSSDIVTKTFASTGTILTYTIQRVASELFINDVPYAWIVVQLDEGGPRITGWIPYVSRPEEVSVGDKVKITTSYKPGFMFEKA